MWDLRPNSAALQAQGRAEPAEEAAKQQRAPPVLQDAFVAFTLLGFGTGWTLVDSLYGTTGAFMAALPEGLLLPSHVCLPRNRGTEPSSRLPCATVKVLKFSRRRWSSGARPRSRSS